MCAFTRCFVSDFAFISTKAWETLNVQLVDEKDLMIKFWWCCQMKTQKLTQEIRREQFLIVRELLLWWTRTNYRHYYLISFRVLGGGKKWSNVPLLSLKTRERKLMFSSFCSIDRKNRFKNCFVLLFSHSIRKHFAGIKISGFSSKLPRIAMEPKLVYHLNLGIRFCLYPNVE